MKLLNAIGVRLLVYPIVIIAGVLIIVSVLLLMKPLNSPGNANRMFVNIQSDGQAHEAYAGSIMVMKDGQVTSKSISGSTPDAFYITADSVSLAIQKQGTGKGTLHVRVERDSKVLDESSTTAEFGMVTLTAK
jgi:hypothetical protein